MLAAVAVGGRRRPALVVRGVPAPRGPRATERLAAIAADERGSVLFEAPGRLAATLRDLAAACGADRPGAVCRELTKLHEQVARGTLGELAAQAADGTIPARGEVVIVVGWGRGSVAVRRRPRRPGRDALAAARAEVERLVADGIARGEAARRVAAATGLPRRALYGVGARD